MAEGKAGRPRIELNAGEVRRLAAIGATLKEMASFFRCSDDTISRNYAEPLEEGRADLTIDLRRWQLLKAQGGDTGMLVWLGKQLLGQKDKSETEVTGKVRLAFDPIVQGAVLTDPKLRAEVLALDEKIERLRLTYEGDAPVNIGENGD